MVIVKTSSEQGNQDQISKNLFLINQKIAKFSQLYQRNIADINLLAVSKKQSVEKIKSAIVLGQKKFAENYVQEAKEKWSIIKNDFSQNFNQIELHLVGHLQSNKVKEAVEIFDVIHSLDSEKLAKIFQKEMAKINKNIQFFIEINIGEESQKSGILPNEADEFINFVRTDCQLNLAGLMCVPPSKEEAAPYFALLKKIANKNNLSQLSIGMSSDFEAAIAIGSTHLRIGTAIFGERN
jgi:hypothetical protein